MVARLPLHLIDPAGASDQLTTPRYDPNTDRVVWTAPGGGGGGGGGRTLLSKQVLAADAPRIDFAGLIPGGGFEHLQLVLRARSSSSSGNASQDLLQVFFNGDSMLANYAARILFIAGGTNNLSVNYAALIPGSAAPAGSAGELDLLIPDYLGTTWPKVARARFGFRFSASVPATVGDSFMEWAGVAAVTDLTLSLVSGGNFVAGSVAYLYGCA